MGNICYGPRTPHCDISVAEFMSVCVFLSEECGKIIREVQESGDLKKQEKGKDGPVTIADLRVQKTLEVCLNTIYPSLKIMGEESATSLANIEPSLDPSIICNKVRSFIKPDFLSEKQVERRDFIENTLRQYYGEDEV